MRNAQEDRPKFQIGRSPRQVELDDIGAEQDGSHVLQYREHTDRTDQHDQRRCLQSLKPGVEQPLYHHAEKRPDDHCNEQRWYEGDTQTNAVPRHIAAERIDPGMCDMERTGRAVEVRESRRNQTDRSTSRYYTHEQVDQ